MATITVTNTNDNGAGSLRDAVAQANANADADTIVFSAALAGQTVTLTGGQLTISNDVTIDGDVNGDNKADITISGNDASRILMVTGGSTDASLLSLNLTRGSNSVFGSAIYTQQVNSLSLIDTSVTNCNGAQTGTIYAVGGTLNITNSTISNNSAAGGGGGVASTLGVLNVTNSTISDNSSGVVGANSSGGGISTVQSTVTIVNSTIVDNHASVSGTQGVHGTYGGGISMFGGSLTLTNSVVAGNTSGAVLNSNDFLTSNNLVVSVNHSIIGTNVSFVTNGQNGNFENVASSDLHLGPLQDNGGTVKTFLPQTGSVLIDAGDTTAAPLGEAANGIPRTIGNVDIGAAETIPAQLVVTVSNDEDDGDYSASDLSLREAVKLANQNSDASTITFDASLAGQTLVLTNRELLITSDVTVDGDTDGDNKADITVSGDNQSRIFISTGNGTNVSLLSLTVADGKTVSSGGAVFAGSGTTLDIVDSTVRDSGASSSGGGIFSSGTLTVTNSTISGNSSLLGYGGGVFVGTGETATFINTTITGNTARWDGGGINTGGGATVVIINSTITGNTAIDEGGGLDIFDGSTVTITNSVIAQNSATSQTDVLESGASSTITATNSVFGSDVADVAGGTNGNLENVTLAQLGLGALGDHGGTVQTINIIDPNSILIDAGDSNLVPLTLIYDANGNPRISRGNVDIGAVEYQNAAPAITDTSFRVVENRSLVGPVPATDAENDTLAFTIAGGKDAGLFDIDGATGALSFKAAPDFENPGDFNGDNVYEVRVAVDDGFGGTDTELISVRLTNGNDRPVITSDGGKLNATVSVAENATAVTKVVASDPDGTSISYAISGGDDKTLFSIDATTGKVTFKSAPDFEDPQDKNHDNAYQITIRATDSDGAIDVQYLTVKVTDVDGVSITGTSAADTVNANKTVAGQPAPTGEEDHIRGLGGKDILNGLGGDDILEGGAARDRLKGGLGHDSFVYLAVTDSSAATGIDVITGFVQGDDTIDLSSIDGGFHFLGEAGFDGTAGALRQRTAGSDVFLEGDTDGNGVADLVILLKGSAGLVLTDGDLGL